MRSQDTQCLYVLVEVEAKTDKVQTAKKVTKINMRSTNIILIIRPYKSPPKLQKDSSGCVHRIPSVDMCW